MQIGLLFLTLSVNQWMGMEKCLLIILWLMSQSYSLENMYTYLSAWMSGHAKKTLKDTLYYWVKY